MTTYRVYPTAPNTREDDDSGGYDAYCDDYQNEELEQETTND